MLFNALQPRNLLYVVGFLLLTPVFIILIFAPLFNAITINSKDLRTLQGELATVEAQRSVTAYFKKEMPYIDQKIKKIDALFIDAGAPIDFINFLERTAASNNLEIEINSANVVKQKDFAGEYINFQFALTGTYTDFMRFLSQIENSPYLINITALQIKLGRQNMPRRAQIGTDLSLKVLAK